MDVGLRQLPGLLPDMPCLNVVLFPELSRFGNRTRYKQGIPILFVLLVGPDFLPPDMLYLNLVFFPVLQRFANKTRS